MPVRQLDYFMGERRLVQTSPLHLLRDTRLGIDGNYWLRRVLQQTAKEPAAVAMGGSPNGLRAALEKELNLFKAQEIHPFFVFHGVTLPRKERAFSTEDLRPAKRASAWDAYDKGRVEQAYSGWSASGGIAPVELVNVAIKVLHEHDVEFMRAPYSSWAQLVYLEKHPEQPIHAIYGATELLMLDVDRIITSVDLEKGSFAWVSKRALVHDLQLTEDQFLDTCILAGCDYCSTFPVFTVDPISFNFKMVYDMVRQYRSGYNAVNFFAQHFEVIKTRYEDVFCRVKSAMRHHLVMTTDGIVQPLIMEQVPSDIHEFMGPRLPDEVYNYLTQGLIAPQVFNTLISGQLVEQAPLCNGESDEYHKFIDDLTPLRTRTLSLITSYLHEYYKTRTVTCTTWFEPNADRSFDHANDQPTSSSSPWTSWCTTQSWIDEELKKQRTMDINLLFCLKAVSSSVQAAKTIGDRPVDKPMEAKEEILANVLFRTLEHRNFLNAKHTHSIYGRALLQACSLSAKSKTVNYSHQSELFLAIELLRLGVLHGNPFSKTYGVVNTAIADKDKPSILLIARAFTLVQMSHQSVPWVGPLSRELLAFNSFSKSLGRSLRTLCESLLLNSFITGQVKRNRNDFAELNLNLPFGTDANTGLGILVKVYLEQLKSKPSSTAANKAVEEALKHVEETFTGCQNVKNELERGFRFWDQLIAAVKILKTENAIDNNVYQQFIKTNQWFTPCRF